MTQKSHPSRSPNAAALFDEMLVVMAQSGDRNAAERLAKRWYPRLARAARRYVGDADEAEALAQECWLGIARGLSRLRDPTRFAPWAFGILRRLGADRIAKAVRERKHLDADAELEGCIPARQDDRAAIAQAFALLPPDQRFAAHLHFVEGLTLREIAQVQAIAEGTAKSRLFHARRKLKAALSPSNELYQGDTP